MAERPPAARSAATLGLLRGAATGGFVLQQCADCGTVQYPPRDACHKCLGPELNWQDVDPLGTLCAATTIHASNEPYFQERLPWRTGIVASAAGPSIIVHLLPGCVTDEQVILSLRLDTAGRGVMVAQPVGTHLTAGENGDFVTKETDPSTGVSGASGVRPVNADFFNDPSGRRILITDGCSPLGRCVVEAILKRGAKFVAAGCSTGDNSCANHREDPRVGWFTVSGTSHWPAPEWYLTADFSSPGGMTDAEDFDAVFDTTV